MMLKIFSIGLVFSEKVLSSWDDLVMSQNFPSVWYKAKKLGLGKKTMCFGDGPKKIS